MNTDAVPGWDRRAFRRVCYEAVICTGGKVIELRISDGVTPNFHQAIVAYRDRTVAVVCRRDAALLAIALPRDLDFTPARESGPLTFIELPELAAALADAGTRIGDFQILTTAELDGPIDLERWPGISSRDLRYWQPASLGEALFNYWD
jgi:hypothetical protein